jgi:hypothetical protein
MGIRKFVDVWTGTKHKKTKSIFPLSGAYHDVKEIQLFLNQNSIFLVRYSIFIGQNQTILKIINKKL